MEGPLLIFKKPEVTENGGQRKQCSPGYEMVELEIKKN
jgi:hypothetical protein